MMATNNDLKLPMYKENVDLRGSNARSMVSVRSTGNSFRKSGIQESAQALIRPG